MTHPGMDRIYTLRMRYGGDPDDRDAAITAAASWMFDNLDPYGQHLLLVTVTDSDGHCLAHHSTGPAADLPAGASDGSAATTAEAASNPARDRADAAGVTTSASAAIDQLYQRIRREIEDQDGGWNGCDVVDARTQWFSALGYPIDGPIPEPVPHGRGVPAGPPDLGLGSTVYPETMRVRDAKVRVFNRDGAPGSDDASDMYVVDVFGVSVLIRLRAGGSDDPDDADTLFVHIDNENRPSTVLAVEVCNGGESDYTSEPRHQFDAPALDRHPPATTGGWQSTTQRRTGRGEQRTRSRGV